MILKFQFNCWGQKHSEMKFCVLFLVIYIFIFFLIVYSFFHLFLRLYYILRIYSQKLATSVGQVEVEFFCPCALRQLDFQTSCFLQICFVVRLMAKT